VTGASRANPTIRASQFRRNVAIAQTHLRATMPGVIFAVISGIFRYLIWHSLIGRVGEIFIRHTGEPLITVIIGGSEQVLAQQGPCLVAAAVNQQGSDVTEGEGRHDREERLLVELARLGPALHASVPNYLT
jgi:hypothetical protein